MGNTNTKESRQGGQGPPEHGQSSNTPGQSARDHGSRVRSRSNRTDLGGLLGISSQSGSNSQNTPERRETRQEREARRLERERQNRLVERERSMREEHVDGGYLVTLGTYVGPEDFSKPVVRQLQIERRLAPFWRGLTDTSDTWTEYQIAAAARGLEVPPPDQPPPEGFFFRPPTAMSSSPPKSTTGNTLAVPQGGNGGGSSTSVYGSSPPSAFPSASPSSGSVPVGALAGTSSPNAVPTSPPGTTTPRSGSSPFKPRAKALAAALSVGSRNSSSTDIAPREIMLPHDPYVNGQPIEVFLYKNADECPICFLSYPPYLNHTRCCGQEICSECFVQIKRADPHYPEGHGDNGDEPNPDLHPEEQAGQLISEPACCPYCQQSEFGVTYDPPPFRRGLVHSSSSLASGIGAMGAAMSSNSSINSAMSPTSLAAPAAGSPPTAGSGGAVTPVSRRRTQSLSASAPNVVTTDRVRPDWATKLATQRAHIARRAAAATALHTAAFLMGNQDNRPFRVSRFSRRNTSSNAEGDASPAQANSDAGDASSTMEPGPRSSSGQAVVSGAAAAATPGNRRTHMEDLEELMFREALRQSLATEEERRRKEEKEERKAAKRREKDERKAAKAMAKRQGGSSSSLYAAGSDSGQSSASASSLSLSGLGSNLGIGSRRRGNSGASNLRVEASVANAMAVSSGGASGTGSAAGGSTASSGNTSPVATVSGDKSASGSSASTSAAQPSGSRGGDGSGKGKAIDRGSEAESSSPAAATSAPRLIPTPSQPSAGPSHLRQMSNASSVASSPPDSASGSFPNHANLHDPRASGLSLGSRSAASDDADHGDDNDPSTSTEPLFNFGSLAAVVGVQIEGRNAGRRISAIQLEETSGIEKDSDASIATSSSPPKESEAHGEHVEHAEHVEHTTPLPRIDTAGELKQAPEVTITPGTPAPTNEFD